MTRCLDVIRQQLGSTDVRNSLDTALRSAAVDCIGDVSRTFFASHQAGVPDRDIAVPATIRQAEYPDQQPRARPSTQVVEGSYNATQLHRSFDPSSQASPIPLITVNSPRDTGPAGVSSLNSRLRQSPRQLASAAASFGPMNHAPPYHVSDRDPLHIYHQSRAPYLSPSQKPWVLEGAAPIARGGPSSLSPNTGYSYPRPWIMESTRHAFSMNTENNPARGATTSSNVACSSEEFDLGLDEYTASLLDEGFRLPSESGINPFNPDAEQP